MRLGESQRWRHIVRLGGVAALLVGSARTGFTGLIPGGGKAAADCYAELDVQGAGTSLRFASADPGSAVTVAMTGLVAGETMVGIDYRPPTGQLFGLGVNSAANTGTLYRLDPQTGAATIIGSAGVVTFVDAVASPVALPAGGYGFDFNPMVDRIRVVTSSGLNFRVNPSTGAPIDGDAVTAGVQPDPGLNGATRSADGVADTNNVGARPRRRCT